MRCFGSVRGALALFASGVLVVNCGGIRASGVPLGGERQREEAAAAPRPSTPPAVSEAGAVPAEDEAAAEQAEVAETVSAPSAASNEPLKPAAPAAFQLRPYAVGQRWSRNFDIEMNVKVGPDLSVDMRMTGHQEARFEVLAVNGENISKLQIEYPVYTSKLSLMGAPQQDSPEALAGKRYIVTLSGGKPDVRDGSGAVPPKKELDMVKDDAREPAEIAKALGELSQLAAKGSGGFSLVGAIALAGGEDDDTKVTRAKATLRSLGTTQAGARTALIDLSYTLTSVLDDDGSLEAQVSGTLLALDAPARYDTVTLQGPVELRPKDPDGMQGRGSLKVTTTYKY